jgi:hypothetical protein
MQMPVTDEETISRFPVGYYPLHPNVSLNFQMNRFYGWVGEEKMLDEMRAAAPRISSYDDWTREMLKLSDEALAAGRKLSAAYYSRGAQFFLDPGDPRFKPGAAVGLPVHSGPTPQCPPRRVAAAWASHLHHAGQAVYGWLDGIP